MSQIEMLQKEIVAVLENAAACREDNPAFHAFLQAQHKTAEHKGYGLRTPQLRRIIAAFRSCFRRLDDDTRLSLARLLFRSGYEEQAQIGVVLQQMSLNAITPERFGYLDSVMDLCASWSTCDSFSLYIMQPLVERCFGSTASLLREWSRSGNMWKRRASVVTFTRKAGKSGNYTGFVLELCHTLAGDPDNLVQKGVGWALKDNLRGNRKKVLAYIKCLRRQGAPSTITLYAIRDLPAAERRRVLKIRRESPRGQ